MAKSTNLNFTQNLKIGQATIVNADSTALKSVYTGSANDSVVKALQIVSDDTSARVINVYVNNGTTDYLLGSVSVAAASGTNGTAAAIDLLGGTLMPGLPYDANGKRVLPLPASYVLKVSTQVAITAAKTVTVTAMVEDY
jgi:hypothetical protein